MARSKIRASQVVEDTLEDKDGNTKVSVETATNEDKIRFTTNGTERMIVTNDGKVGIGTSSPISELDVAGKVAITTEVSTPAQPADGQGYLYTKADGKLYWRSYDMPETDITAGASGGAGSLEYAAGHVDVTTSGKPVNWINAASVSAANAIKTWFIVPKDTVLDKVIVSIKGNNFNNSNDGTVTLSIYKNQGNYNSTIVNQTVNANDFSEKVSNMGGQSSDCNQKIFDGLNQDFAEGDLIQIKITKSSGSDKEAIITMVFDTPTSSGNINKSVFSGRAHAIPASSSNPWVFSFGDGQGNSATNSDSNNKETIIVAPYDGIIKDLIVTVHQSLFQTSTYGDITLVVYKNSVEFDTGSKFINLTTGADTFAGKGRLIGMSFTYFARQRNFADLFGGNVYTVSQGDIIQVSIAGSTSSSYSNLDISLSLVIEET